MAPQIVGLLIALVSILVLASDSKRRELKVGIYPYIPDINGDQYKSLLTWIETTFERQNRDIDLTVFSPDSPPYNVVDIYDPKSIANYFQTTDDAAHILEIDTVILGDTVDTGVIAEIGHNKYGLLTENYLPFSLEAVTVNGAYYAVPTYICGNFLMGINTDQTGTSKCPLSNGKDSFRQLDTVLNQCKTDMLNPPRKITLLGNVDGSYTLPLFYIDAYIDKYGAGSVYDVIYDPLKIVTELEIASNLVNYLEFCLFENQNFDIDGCICSNGTVDFNNNNITDKIIRGESITAYGYSDFNGYFLKQAADMGVQIDIYDIIAPPFSDQNNFLMFTDGLIINKRKLTPDTQPDIDAFIQFYTSLSTRLSIAFGDDILDSHPARYLLQARSDFYSERRVKNDDIYAKLSPFLRYAVATPNKDFYQEKDILKYVVEVVLDVVGFRRHAPRRGKKMLHEEL